MKPHDKNLFKRPQDPEYECDFDYDEVADAYEEEVEQRNSDEGRHSI